MFVVNRVGKIEELVGITNWRWLSTKDNVVDDATRDMQDIDLSPSSRWWTGPPFLSLSENDWPTENAKEFTSIDDETLEVIIKTCQVLYMCADHVLPDAKGFSSWTKLIRFNAWMFLFIAGCHSHLKCNNKRIKVAKDPGSRNVMVEASST